ncbi:right-handed parallel beta-helix repeat-containing protein [Methanolobus sp. ZRKC3]|uniref:right-handed parallel beta-helix repeat-containing protein n=1 Tax=Methanolobus sp. ZRKC3 TaxID=3125786 RepID=UPI0032489562
MNIRSIIVFLLVMLIAVQVGSATITQTGNLITIDDTTPATLTDVNTAISNTTALQNLGGGEWLLSANILVESGATFSINDLDCTWLKMNGTGGQDTYIQTWGTLNIDDTKITSWDTGTGDVIYSTVSTPRPHLIYGDSSRAKDSKGHIIGSNISYLGYSGTGKDGLYFYGWYNSGGTASLTDNTFINLYSMNFRRYFGDIVIDNCTINDSISTAINSWAFGSWDSFTLNNSIIDTSNPSSAYTGGLYLGPAATIKNTEFTVRQGAGIHVENEGSVFDNITIYEGAYSGFELRKYATITNSTVYDCGKGGLYLVYGDSIPGSWNLTLVSSDNGGGVRVYKIHESPIVDLSNVYIYNRGGAYNSALSVLESSDVIIYGANIMETQSVCDIYMMGVTPYNVTFQDINDVDDKLHIKFDTGGNTDYNGTIVKSNNIYLENQQSSHYDTFFYPDRSSLYFTKDADTPLEQHVVFDDSLTLIPSSNSVAVNYTKNSHLTIDYLSNDVERINFTLSESSGVTVAINNTHASDYELYTSTDSLIESKTASGLTTYTTTLDSGDYYIAKLICETVSPSDDTPSSTIGEYQTFPISTSATATVTWLKDGVPIETDTDVTYAEVTVVGEEAGTFNITAIANDGNTEVSQTWTWMVTEEAPATPPRDQNTFQGLTEDANAALAITSVPIMVLISVTVIGALLGIVTGVLDIQPAIIGVFVVVLISVLYSL